MTVPQQGWPEPLAWGYASHGDTRARSSVADPSCDWLLCTGVKLKGTSLTGAGLRLLDTTIESGSLEGLTILGTGSGTGFGLLGTALGNAILVSLTTQAWALVVGLVVAAWVKNPGWQWYGACRSCLVPAEKKEFKQGLLCQITHVSCT